MAGRSGHLTGIPAYEQQTAQSRKWWLRRNLTELPPHPAELESNNDSIHYLHSFYCKTRFPSMIAAANLPEILLSLHKNSVSCKCAQHAVVSFV